MRGWKRAALLTALCMSIGMHRASAQAAHRSARTAVPAGAPSPDTSAVFSVRLVRCGQPQQLSAPFGRLARPVAFTLHQGKGVRKVYDSTMRLAWSYRSAVPQGPGPTWTYDGARAEVMDLADSFKNEAESEITYAPSWSAQSDLAPAGGFGELVSLLVRYDDAAGGAHGSSYEHFVTLSARTGLPLRLSQVLNERTCARIHAAIADSLRPEPVDERTAERIDQRFGVRMVQGRLRVSIALGYLFDCTDHPPTTFHFELSPRELRAEWRNTK